MGRALTLARLHDRCFYKLQQFTSEAAAQRYMDSKPVPYVQRGSKKYIVDHHHTLAALELSGFDVEITLEQVRSFDKTEQTLEGFWGYLEGRGWAFLRDENYNRIPIAKLPKARNASAAWQAGTTCGALLTRVLHPAGV